jgi:hypothetical protein
LHLFRRVLSVFNLLLDYLDALRDGRNTARIDCESHAIVKAASGLPERGTARLSDNHMEMFDERHYTPEEIAELWHLSSNKVRYLFANEPDVIKDIKPETRNKREYCSMRISESAARRVYAKLTALKCVSGAGPRAK